MNLKRMLLLLALSAAISAVAGPQKVKTSVEKVTLFIDGAQVTRTRQVDLPAGNSTVVFTGLSPYLDDKSMQVSAKGPFTVTAVNRLFNHTDSLERSTRQKTLEETLEETQRQAGPAEGLARGHGCGERTAENELLGRQPERRHPAGRHQGVERVLCRTAGNAEKQDALPRRGRRENQRAQTADSGRTGESGRQTVGPDERSGGADRSPRDLQGVVHADLLRPQRRLVPLVRHPFGRVVGAGGDLLQGQYFPEHRRGVEERRLDALLVEPQYREHRPEIADLAARLRSRPAPLQPQHDEQHRVGNSPRPSAQTPARSDRPDSRHDHRRRHRHPGQLLDHRSQRCFQPAIQLRRLHTPNGANHGQHDERRDAGGRDEAWTTWSSWDTASRINWQAPHRVSGFAAQRLRTERWRKSILQTSTPRAP